MYHKEKSKTLYMKARMMEREILETHTAIQQFAEVLPEDDEERRKHCKRMGVYFKECQQKVAEAIKRLEGELGDAEAEERRAKADLRELRCIIMTASSVPATWDRPPGYFTKT